MDLIFVKRKYTEERMIHSTAQMFQGRKLGNCKALSSWVAWGEFAFAPKQVFFVAGLSPLKNGDYDNIPVIRKALEASKRDLFELLVTAQSVNSQLSKQYRCYLHHQFILWSESESLSKEDFDNWKKEILNDYRDSDWDVLDQSWRKQFRLPEIKSLN